MPLPGYSDRINHALAYAAKHHDQQVRRGTRAPFVSLPANVAIILTRYGCTDDMVVGGILYEVVEDAVRQGANRDALVERFAGKFGQEMLDMVLGVVPRREDDDGIVLSGEEQRQDILGRLEVASDGSRWILASSTLHHAGSLLADLRRTVDASAVWTRAGLGRTVTPAWCRALVARLRELHFSGPIVEELSDVTDELERRAALQAADATAG